MPRTRRRRLAKHRRTVVRRVQELKSAGYQVITERDLDDLKRTYAKGFGYRARTR